MTCAPPNASSIQMLVRDVQGIQVSLNGVDIPLLFAQASLPDEE